MSSVIVVDSSDEEEVPAKRAFIAPSIPATITPIKGTNTQCPSNVSTNQLKHKKMKPRTIPSGITITRRSPINLVSSNSGGKNSNTPPVVSSAMPNMSDSLAAKISAATLAATTKLNSMISKTATPSLIKQNAGTSISNVKEKQAATSIRPSPQHINQKPQQQQQQMQPPSKQQQPQLSQQGLPLLSQLPQLQPSPSVLRKRLSTAAASPTQQIQTQQQQQLPRLQKSKQQQNPPKLQQQQKPQLLQLDAHTRKLNTPPSTITSIGSSGGVSTAVTSNATLLPLISSVQSMAAGATPPLQLLATPPHSAATTFSDQQLFSPKLMHTTCSLPPSTIVTAARPQLSSSTNTNNTNNNGNNCLSNNNKNINNNFKIMLPPKSCSSNVGVNLTTSSPVTATLPTPVALQQSSTGPRIAYVNSLAAQISPPTNKTSSCTTNKTKTSTSTATATVVPVAITAAAQLASLGNPPSSGTSTTTSMAGNALTSVRRVKPTTLLRKNDEAWLKRTGPTITTTAKNFNDDDLVLELLPDSPNTTKTRHQTPSQIAETFQNITKPHAASIQKTSPASVPLANKPASLTSSTQKSTLHRPAFPLKIDLTDSPDKTTSTRSAETITISPITSPKTSAKNKPLDLITNGDGDATTQSTKSITPISNEKCKSADERLPLTQDYEELLKVCHEVDKSIDMEKLVKTKLVKYYYNVHPYFVHSKGFGKNLRTVIANIRKEPDLVYLHLKIIVDELKVRSKNKEVVPNVLVKIEEKTDSTGGSGGDERDRTVSGGGSGGDVESNAEDMSSTGNKHTDEQIKKLNKALYILTKRIEVLESAEVDWEDEDSSYLQVERFKKRACQIYEKICDLTGESKNAHRLVKKPIHFNGTSYIQFNKTLQAYVNRTKEFPDYFDVLRMLEHCNRQYEYALANFEMKRIAHDAFIKVGKLLQSRRKTDLYETVTHFTAHEKDPAIVDPVLQAKLSDNQKKRTRISDVIEKFAREQDMIREELKEARQAKVARRSKSESNDDEDDAIASTSTNAAKADSLRKNKHKRENGEIVDNVDSGCDNDDDEDEEDDDEDDDEDQVNGSDLEADVEKLANGDLSDVESDVEIVINRSAVEINEDSKPNCKDSDQQQQLTKDINTKGVGTSEKTANTTTKKPTTSGTQGAVTVVTKSTAATLTQTKTSVTNNLTKQKTADPLACDASLISTRTSLTSETDSKQAAAIANGRMKSVTGGNSSSSVVIKPTTQSPTIKIVSVSSLQKRDVITGSSATVADKKQSGRQDVSLTKMPMPTQKQRPAKAIKRQRTVAEIVISDEES